MQNHFNKHGDVFEFYILKICSKNNLIKWEQHYIDTLNPEFNICKTAGSSLGRKHDAKAKLKIRNAKLNKRMKPRSAGHTANLVKSRKGWSHSEDAKLKMSKNKRFDKHPKSVFTNKQVSQIKYDINNGIAGTEIAKNYNVTPETIAGIKRESNWADIEPKITNKPKPKLAEEIVRQIKTELGRGNKFQKEIAKEFNIGYATISNISTGRQWKNVSID